MYKSFQVTNLQDAIEDIVLPSFDQFLKDLRKSDAIKLLIEKEITKIELMEDKVINMTSSLDLSSNKDNYITLDGYGFRYNKKEESFEYSSSDKEESAKSRIYYNEGLSDSWKLNSLIKNRIKAILTTIQPAGFDKAKDIVQSNLDYNEFIAIVKASRN